jgi:hypothetical protein
MIEIIARNGPPEALLCAAFICDYCRRQVVKSGNILYAVRYKAGETRESSPLFVSHKACTQVVEAALKADYPYEDGWLDCWEEASHFIGHLTNNLAHSFDEDPNGTYLPQRVVLSSRRPKPGPLRATQSAEQTNPRGTGTTTTTTGATDE